MDQITTSSSDDSAAKSISIVPCAACKFQRRKCPPSCPLAPYFPASNSQQFLNARRFFGVSNLSRALNRVKPNERDDTAMTMIFEANTRALDLVGGCTRIIRELEFHIEQATAELDFIRFKLKACRGVGETSLPVVVQPDIGFGMHLFEGMPTLMSSYTNDCHFPGFVYF
ncbi:LOB domain-containing protein 22-like [Impatiens glandulifera]|uniref:LOB domain-containing protein 22-like n=1 Tax=Impatiens glandulifera TaxID=253017 RepID=UPI001FB0B20E|nr:LOB domain-containing protein 22-like [Impatiens glandulifera]